MGIISRAGSSRLGRAALGGFAGASMLLAAAAPVQASSLTSAQIGAITSMLTAFNVDAGTITNIQTVLSGGTPPNVTTGSSTTAVGASVIGFLKRGDHGQGVCVLHAILAADPTISVNITASDTGGNCPFGPLTVNALKHFQSTHGIAALGFVGPKTLAALEAELASNPVGIENEDTSSGSSTPSGGEQGDNQGGGHGRVCVIVPPGHLIAPGWLRHHDNQAPVVPTCQTLPPGILGLLGGGNGGSSTTTLSIANVSASGITSSSATVTWTTTVGATGQVDYGTSASYGSSSALNSSLLTSHSIALTGLSAATTYHFRVDSTVGSQSATSSDMTFTTSAASDTTPPVISSISAGGIASTTATISWTTDESATSKVYYSTASPINLSTALTQLDSSLVTSHLLSLSGLAASTTYNYVVQSADASTNTATSSSQSFTTTN